MQKRVPYTDDWHDKTLALVTDEMPDSSGSMARPEPRESY